MNIACLAMMFMTVIDMEFKPRIVQEDNRIVLENQLIRRVLVNDGEVWRTESFSRADGSDVLRVESDEFLIRLMDGNELTISDYVCIGQPEIGIREGVRSVRMRYEPRQVLPEEAPYLIIVEYDIDRYLHKRIVLQMSEGSAVDRLEVERFRTDMLGDLGGLGQPIFLGDTWFTGLTYPGSQTEYNGGLVTLAHYPGLVKKQDEEGNWIIESKQSVFGTGLKGDPLELAFQDYIDAIRVRYRNLLHYNSWYDLQGNELTHENLVHSFMGFKENLLDPYELTMDSFVPDDGWQEPDSIWEVHEGRFPNGLAPLRDVLEANGSRLGIWMPFNGFNLNVNWGVEEKGYGKSDKGRYYCLAEPKYNAAIHDAVRRIILEGNLNYIKHDFNQLRCTAEGHGHLPDDRHGFEANLDAELELLAYERSLQRNIFLNVTSYVWHSPWWLQHADTIWMDTHDFGYDKTQPQLAPREWAMSFRDAHMYKVYNERRHLVPVSDMMTCGIIHGPHCKLGGDMETLREWSDYVVMFFGRGVQLQEYYITPDWLTPDRWEILGKATKWAVENRKLLEKTVMVGGDARKGEAYGYAHWKGEEGLLVLRNPDVREQTIDVPFDKTTHYRGENGRSYWGRVIYPYVEAIPAKFESGKPISMAVPGCSVMVVEMRPGNVPSAEPVEQLQPIEWSTDLRVEQGRPVFRTTLQVPDEAMQRCDLYLILTCGGKVQFPNVKMMDVQVNGEGVNTRMGWHETWFLQSVDLRDWAGKEVEVAVQPDEDQIRLFDENQFELNAWWVADREVESPHANNGTLPMAIGQNHRRMTVELLPKQPFGMQ